MTMTFHEHEIPFFGGVMESVAHCSSCGYRHTDVMVLEENEPVRYILKIDKENISTRVVKSGRATIKIPELGIEITPGIESEGYISNVEGVLVRIEDVLTMIKKWKKEKAYKADELLEKIKRVKEGKAKITLIIEDPSGNSAIISEKALRENWRERNGNKTLGSDT
jgi:zinc finger protein